MGKYKDNSQKGSPTPNTTATVAEIPMGESEIRMSSLSTPQIRNSDMPN